MAGLHIQKSGYTSIQEMMKDVITEMVKEDAGFVLKYPASISDINSINISTTTPAVSDGIYDKDILGTTVTDRPRWCAILEAGAKANVNATIAQNQKWAIKFEWDIGVTDDGILDIIVGTPGQFNYTTGEHTFYTAKYNSKQKREIVAGDANKIDKAYDYKEVLGILGTTFRQKECILTYPNIVVPGSKEGVDDITANPANGTDTNYPNGDIDTVLNYKLLDINTLNMYASINVTYLSTDLNLLRAAGTSGAVAIAYDSDLDLTSDARYEANTYVNYKTRTYKVLSTITKSVDNAIQNTTVTNVFISGIPASVINKKYLISGFGGANDKKLFKTKVATSSITSVSPVPSGLTDSNKGKWYFTDTQVIKVSTSTGGSSPYYISGPDHAGVYTYKTVPITSSTVITDANKASYGITDFYSKDLTIAEVADLYNLDFVTNLSESDLTPATASYFNMQVLPDGTSLNPAFIYNTTEDRLYQIKSLIDTVGSPKTQDTAFPTSTAAEFEQGAYNLSYLGPYSEFLIAKSVGATSYYDIFESEDADGYDTKLMDGDFSAPAIRRNKSKSSKMFFNRQSVKLAEAPAFPMTFTLSTTNRGVVFSVHEETSDDSGNRNSWMVVQRPVDHLTGEVFITGKAPVHCMYSIMSKTPNKPWLHEDMQRGTVDYGYSVKKNVSGKGVDFIKSNNYTINVPAPEAVRVYRFIVREADVNAPYPTHVYVKNAFGTNMDYALGGFPFGVPADRHTPDYAAVINTKQQVSISEGNKYVITFPNGLNTARFAYTHEIDMIAYTSADVISSGTTVQINAYSAQRTYTALHANGPNNTGMRILVLRQGGGID